MSASAKPELTENQQMVVDTVIDYEKMLDTVEKMSLDAKDLGYFGIAYEYFLLDMEEEGVRIMEKISVGFFDKPLAAAMKKDKAVVEIAQVMISKLIEIGFIKIEVKK